MAYVRRNQALHFAALTRQNLEHIEAAYASGQDVHVVTQVALSLLGLVVFPYEKHLVASISSRPIALDPSTQRPYWRTTLGSASTFGELIYHLRNAAAHGRMTFSSDSGKLEEVDIEIEDWKPGATSAYWRASINAANLRSFCLTLVELIEDTIG